MLNSIQSVTESFLTRVKFKKITPASSFKDFCEGDRYIHPYFEVQEPKATVLYDWEAFKYLLITKGLSIPVLGGGSIYLEPRWISRDGVNYINYVLNLSEVYDINKLGTEILSLEQILFITDGHASAKSNAFN